MWKKNRINYLNILYFEFFFSFILGCLLSTANPPISFPYIVIVVLAIFSYFWFKKRPSYKKAFLLGFLFGFGYFTLSLLWIVEPFLIESDKSFIFAPFALFLLAALLSSFWGTAFLLSSYKDDYRNKLKSFLKLTVFFSLAEYLRSILFTGFPWALLSLAFIETPVSQTLSIFGPFWLTFIIIFLSFIIPFGMNGIILSICGFIILNLYGMDRYHSVENKIPNKIVRIVQPNIFQKDKWKSNLSEMHFSKLIKLSNENADTVDIIIWPETAVPFFLEFKQDFQKNFSNKIKKQVILGARRYDKDTNEIFNSAYFFNKNGEIQQIYDKKHLVPFGEYIPIIDLINIFVETGVENNGITGFSVGKKENEITIDDNITLAIFICYESIFSNEVDKNVNNSDLIIHLTNDAWFGSYSGPQQHFSQIRARAIEQGLPVIRSANTGISALIDPYGRIVKKIPLNMEGFIDVNLPKKIDQTLYSKWGAENWNIFLISLFALLIFLCFKRKNSFI